MLTFFTWGDYLPLTKAGAKPTYLDQGEEKYLYYAAPKRLQKEVANIFVEQLGAAAMMIEEIKPLPSSPSAASSSSSQPVEPPKNNAQKETSISSLWGCFSVLFPSSKPPKEDDKTNKTLLEKKKQ